MSIWLLLGLALYGAGLYLDVPRSIAFRLGDLLIAAWLGYWLDRHLYRRRLDEWESAPPQIRRAIIVAAAMIAVGLGR